MLNDKTDILPTAGVLYDCLEKGERSGEKLEERDNTTAVRRVI